MVNSDAPAASVDEVHFMNHSLPSEVSDGVTAPQFPMWVLPIEAALAMPCLKPHENLLAEGSLIKWAPGMDAIFFSHTWLGRREPDPHGVKMALIRHLLKRAQAGTLEAHPHWTSSLAHGKHAPRVTSAQFRRARYIWIDWACIPQANRVNQAAAIASLPSYVTCASIFICLTPPGMHENGEEREVHGWARRGWCRMEYFCNGVEGRKPLVVAQSPSDIIAHPPFGMQQQPVPMGNESVGNGDFTVDSDRVALGPIIARVIAARKERALVEGDLNGFRFLHAISTGCLAGTGHHLEEEKDLEDWMQVMRFKLVGDSKSSGLTPLLFAVVSGRCDVVSALLDAGASINLPLRQAQPRFYLERCATPLIAACRNQDSPALVKLLLSRGANPRAGTALSGINAFTAACSQGHVGNIQVLLEHDPGLAAIPMTGGIMPIECAVSNARVQAFEHLIERLDAKESSKVIGATTEMGVSIAAVAVSLTGELSSLESVLRSGVDVNNSGTVRNPGMRAFFRVAQFACRVSRKPPSVLEHVVYALHSTTPLHLASYNGMLGATNLLLDNGADAASRKHPLRITPLQLASMRGHEAVVCALLRAGASVTTADSRGRTALDWAKKRGHASIVEMLQTQRSTEYGREAHFQPQRQRRRLLSRLQGGHLVVFDMGVECSSKD